MQSNDTAKALVAMLNESLRDAVASNESQVTIHVEDLEVLLSYVYELELWGAE